MTSTHLMSTYPPAPVTFVRGAGSRLWDDNGKEYLDFLAGISVCSVGHCHPAVVEAVREASAQRIPVVVCSRCATGRVEPVYGRGGGRDLEGAGALFAGDLAGPKVRVLLQIALGAGLDVPATLAAEAR